MFQKYLRIILKRYNNTRKEVDANGHGVPADVAQYALDALPNVSGMAQEAQKKKA